MRRKKAPRSASEISLSKLENYYRDFTPEQNAQIYGYDKNKYIRHFDKSIKVNGKSLKSLGNSSEIFEGS